MRKKRGEKNVEEERGRRRKRKWEVKEEKDSLVHRPSYRPVFDRLQYEKNRGERSGPFIT